MSIPKRIEAIESRIPGLAFVIVALYPLLNWIVDSISAHQILKQNPYGLAEFNMLLLSAILLVIYKRVDRENSDSAGDESKIIMNRNESDYYEIWQEVRSYREITIEALGHSFNTLWYNFIKKFLYEFMAHEEQFDSISIHLISTVENPSSFDDMIRFYKTLDAKLAKKLTIVLARTSAPPSYFTGLCVNRRALWLSIREPHKTSKVNEHVREWRRGSSPSAEKMVNWYIGIVEHLETGAKSRVILNRDYLKGQSLEQPAAGVHAPISERQTADPASEN